MASIVIGMSEHRRRASAEAERADDERSREEQEGLTA
jgi:hypothetical protein